MDNSIKVVIFSVDLVFTEIIKRILERFDKRSKCKILSSFSEAASISMENSIDIIVVDDSVIGRSSYELISFLRNKQKITTPIISFGVAEYNGDTKAYSAGADQFIAKPFKYAQVEKSLYEFSPIEKEVI